MISQRNYGIPTPSQVLASKRPLSKGKQLAREVEQLSNDCKRAVSRMGAHSARVIVYGYSDEAIRKVMSLWTRRGWMLNYNPFTHILYLDAPIRIKPVGC